MTEVGEHGVREIEAREHRPRGLRRRRGARSCRARAGAAGSSGQPLVEFLDLPLLRGDEPRACGLSLPRGSRRGRAAIAFYSSPERLASCSRRLAPAPAVTGTLLDALPEGPEGRDRPAAASSRACSTAAKLQSVTRLKLLAGENAAAIANADGDVGGLAVRAGDAVGAKTYRLTGLLRGQAGTEGAMRSPLAAGARVRAARRRSSRGWLCRAGEIGLRSTGGLARPRRDIGAATYAEPRHIVSRARTAAAVAGARARARAAAGDLAIGWVRRTRHGR